MEAPGPGVRISAVHCMPALHPIILNLRGNYHHSHFTDEETEAQQGMKEFAHNHSNFLFPKGAKELNPQIASHLWAKLGDRKCQEKCWEPRLLSGGDGSWRPGRGQQGRCSLIIPFPQALPPPCTGPETEMPITVDTSDSLWSPETKVGHPRPGGHN